MALPIMEVLFFYKKIDKTLHKEDRRSYKIYFILDMNNNIP